MFYYTLSLPSLSRFELSRLVCIIIISIKYVFFEIQLLQYNCTDFATIYIYARGE